MHDQECWHSTSSTGVGRGGGSDDNSAAALMLAAAAAAARECSAGVGSISMSVQEAAANAEVDHRKQSLVERKRTREKKRHFDTNSQFTALAELVKETSSSGVGAAAATTTTTTTRTNTAKEYTYRRHSMNIHNLRIIFILMIQPSTSSLVHNDHPVIEQM